MLDIQPIITQNLYLIPYKKEFDEYIMHLHDKSFSTTYDDNDPVKSRQQYLDYIHSLIETNVAAPWIVRHKKFKLNLGIIYLTDIVQSITANLHPIIDREGYKMYLELNGKDKFNFMEEAAKEVLRYGFNNFKLQRIGGAFFKRNRFAIDFVKRLGFQQEGYIRRGTKVKNKPEDLIILGILKEEIKL